MQHRRCLRIRSRNGDGWCFIGVRESRGGDGRCKMINDFGY